MIYKTAIRVRQSDIDSFNHVNHAVYANYLQEAAIENSAERGFTHEWYLSHNSVWVIRKLSIRYYQQARYRDELEISTWISDFRRISSHREYLITRISDGAKVVRARAKWVYVNRETFQPLRIPQEFLDSYEPTNLKEDLGIRVPKPEFTENAFRYITRRRVQMRELDGLRHVNNVTYLQWVEQAYFDALRSGGHPVENWRKEGVFAFQGGHEMEYFESAFDNEEIEIRSWICELGRVCGAWTHEIYNATTKKLLARDYSLGVFVDERGKLTATPQKFVSDILAGGKQ
jgi:acyl-CoA thioester hydrolase